MHRTRAAIGGLAIAFVFARAPAFAIENGAAPAAYKQLIADGDTARTLRSRLALAEPLGVSSLRPSVLTQPGAWTACIKVVSQGLLPPGAKPDSADGTKRPVVERPPPQGPVTVSYYAIFFRDGEIAESRRSVAIDHCEQSQYSPLPKAGKAKAGSKDAG